MIEARINLDLQALERRLGQLAREIPEVVRRAVLASAMDVTAHVVRSKLSGQVLRRRTGTLARDVLATPRASIAGEKVVGLFGTSRVYGRVHEEGFKGTVTVRPHQRVIRRVFGRTIPARIVSVSAHQRVLDIRARRYLRTGFAERLPAVQPRLVRAIAQLAQTGRLPAVGELL